MIQITNYMEWKGLNTDLRVFRVQCKLCSSAEIYLAPESWRSLSLRSSSLRQEDGQLRTNERASQLFPERLQQFSLTKKKKNKQTNTDFITIDDAISSYYWQHLIFQKWLKILPYFKQKCGRLLLLRNIKNAKLQKKDLYFSAKIIQHK